MQKRNKPHPFLVTAALTILLVTLFFGLKPKGFRYINQVNASGGNKHLVFTNIGMMYSREQLRSIGIVDSFSVIVTLKPQSVGRRLSRIVSLLDSNGNARFTLDQWMDGCEFSIWDEHSKRIARTGIDGALSSDSARTVVAGISSGALFIASKEMLSLHASRSCASLRGLPGRCRLLFGFGAFGESPWRGEFYSLALTRNRVTDAQIKEYLLCSNNGDVCNSEAFAAFFDGGNSIARQLQPRNGIDWPLLVPRFPRFFKHQILEALPHPLRLDRSLFTDMLVNLFGFIPFGAAFYFLFSSITANRRRTFWHTLAAACITSLAIELAQVFIPTRTSQIPDVVLNVGGAWLGVLLCKKLLHPVSSPTFKR